MHEEEERRITHIVREIMGGKSVSDYPFEMIPRIKNCLYDLKEKAISLEQNDRVKLIQHAFTQISEVEKKHKKEILQNENSQPEKTKPSDSELEDMINKMIAGEKMDPFNINLIPPLIKCLKKRIKTHILQDEFEMAQNYEDLHQILLTEFRNGETTGHKEWMQKRIIEKLEKAEQKLRELEEMYEQKLNQNEQMTAQAIENINQQNQIELNNFDAETQGPLPPFSKTFSSELQNLRETQKKLIICKRYKEAAIVRDKIKEIVEIELEGIEDKYFRSREARREQLIDMYYQRIDCILTKSESQKIDIDYIFGKKITSLKKQIDFYERQLDMINSSKRLKMQLDPSVSFDISPNEYQPKTSKTRTPMSVRHLSMREPWSLLFDSSKRLNVTKIDELAEPHWKSIEPRQTDTEVYSQFVSSLISTPKTWDKVHQRKVSSARSQKQKWQDNQSIYSSNRRNRSEEKKRCINMKLNYYEGNENGDIPENVNAPTPNRIKKKRNKHMRSSSQARSKIDITSLGTISNNNYSSNVNQSRNLAYLNDNIRNNKKEKSSNIRKSSNNYNSSSCYNNNNTSSYNSQKHNFKNNNKVSISNVDNLNNLVSNFESASTFNKSNNTDSNQSSSAKTLKQINKYSSLSNTSKSSKLSTTAMATQSLSSTGNIQRVSINSNTNSDINGENTSYSIKKSKKSNKSDPLELSSNIYYNGLTYTQLIDARRNKAIQTKKKKGIANLFGDKSDFERFCQTVPPSRKEQLPNYL